MRLLIHVNIDNNIGNKSKEKFERPEHQRGLINLDDRNK